VERSETTWRSEAASSNFPAITWEILPRSSRDYALAIGDPFGVGQTVTMGIVSAKDAATSDRGLRGFHPDGCADQSGNSGGALINDRGELWKSTRRYCRTAPEQ